MTTRFTNEEWDELIRDEQAHLSLPQEQPESPSLRTAEDIAKLIDHTLLKVEATSEQIDTLCAQAREHALRTVCVRPHYVSRAVSNLHGTNIGVAAVISFPHGTDSRDEKIHEAQDAVRAGATELDIVLNYPLLSPPPNPASTSDSDLLPQYTAIFDELSALRASCGPPTVLKLILETSGLDRKQIVAACVLAKAAGFEFVKTSTGFRGGGATVQDVALMHAVVAARKYVGDGEGKGDGWERPMQVKASGGIRTLVDVREMVWAGAGRIGTSSGVEIMREMRDMENRVTASLEELERYRNMEAKFGMRP